MRSPSLSDEEHSRQSLGSVFDLRRQETLLKREIAIKRLKEQLSGKKTTKVIDTGKTGSPVTLLAAGVEGHRYAILSFPDGRQIRVREGEVLPDGIRVLRIDGSGVSVRKHERLVTYPYGENRVSGQGESFPRFSGFSPPPVPRPGGRP